MQSLGKRVAAVSRSVPTTWFPTNPDRILIARKQQVECPVTRPHEHGQSYLGEGTLTASCAFSSSSLVYDDGNQPLLHGRRREGRCGWAADA